MTETESVTHVMAMHQPNYIPWLGFFYKMSQCDTFVYLDTVQYPRGQSFANRNKVKTHNGTTWLTIPISQPSGHDGKASYREVSFAGTRWKKKHLKTLKFNYKKAPYFDEVYELMESHIQSYDSFAELTIHLNNAIAEYLNIDTRTVLLSNILDDYGEKTQLIIDICNQLECGEYLSGTGGGKEYNDEGLMNKHDIQLTYSHFEHPEYPQLWGEFASHMSIIDLLFNCGPESREVLGMES
jgi:hypothetical protein